MSCLTIVNRREKFQFHATVTLEQLSSVPFVNGVLFAKLRLLNFRHQRKYSERVPLRDHTVQWNSNYEFAFRLMRNADCFLDSCFLKISIRQEVRGGKGSVKLGFVNVDLSCFVGTTTRRRYILNAYDQRQRQNNALLYLTFSVRPTGGVTDHLWRLPPESNVHLVPLEPSEPCSPPPASSNGPHLLTSVLGMGPNLSLSRPPPSNGAPSVQIVTSGRSVTSQTTTTTFPTPTSPAVPHEDESSEAETHDEMWADVEDDNQRHSPVHNHPVHEEQDANSEAASHRKNSNDSWKSFSNESSTSASPHLHVPSVLSRPVVLDVQPVEPSLSRDMKEQRHSPKKLAVSSTSPRDEVVGGSSGRKKTVSTHQRQPSSLSGISLLQTLGPAPSTGGTLQHKRPSAGDSGRGSHTASPVALIPCGLVENETPLCMPPFHQRHHVRQASLDSGPFWDANSATKTSPLGFRGGYTASGVYDPSLERTRDKRSEEKQLLLDATRANNDELVSEVIRLNLQRPDKSTVSVLNANSGQLKHPAAGSTLT